MLPDQVEEIQDKYDDQRKALFKLMKKHDDQKAEIDLMANKVTDLDNTATKKLLDIQYNLRQLITEEEWNKILKPI